MNKIFLLLITILVIDNIDAQTNINHNGIYTFSNGAKDTLKQKIRDGNITNQHSLEEMVYTPTGRVPKSRVHFVNSNQHLNIGDSSVQIINTKTGKVDQEFYKDMGLYNNSSNKNKASIADSIFEWGYITYAYWENKNITPITYFSTNWVVPSNPPSTDDKIIYLFNGLQGDGILQPVLQWGGSNWSIANWYVTGSDAFSGPGVKVSPGTQIQGVIKMVSQSINSYSYSSSFTGNLFNEELLVNNISEPKLAIEALEAYGINSYDDYPVEKKIRMTEIQLKTDTLITFLNWKIINNYPQFGHHADIVSNNTFGDEIDLYFHDRTSTKTKSSLDDRDSTGIIVVSPNPTQGLLHISIYQLVLGVSKVELYNQFGVLTQEVVNYNDGNEFDVHLANSPAGFYIVRISFNQTTKVFKVLKI